MNVHSEPSGASPGPDDDADHATFPTESEDKTESKPEKSQLVYPDPNHAQQQTVPGLDLSRKLGIPSSELAVEISSNGNAQQPFGRDGSNRSSESLVSLQSPPGALPETEVGGKKGSMKLPLRRVVSSGNSYGRQPKRRSRSEGTTPPKDKLAVLLLETKELTLENQELKESLERSKKLLEDSLEKERSVKLQQSIDESISPLVEQQLKDRIISLQKDLQALKAEHQKDLHVLEDEHQKRKSRIQSLQQKNKDESEEKKKFEKLYRDEKWRSEESAKKAAQVELKIMELERVLYLVCAGAELSPEQESLVRSVRVEQVLVRELDEAAAPTDQKVPDFDQDPAEHDGLQFSEWDVLPLSLGQEPISQDTGLSVQTLYGNLESLARTGVGNKKCTVCFKGEPIDSHIITRKLLETACGGQECRTLLSVDLKRKSTTIVTPTTWSEKLECEGCDRSTSHLEGEFVNRCCNYYKPTSSTPLHDNDALVFLLYGYRTLCMRNVLQYAVKDNLASYKELELFMVQVWKIRRVLKQPREIDFDDVRSRVLFHVFTEDETGTSSYRIALVLCNVDLTAVDPVLGLCPLIYTKALRCCWAVLLGEHKANDVQQHFPRMINRIDRQLSQEKIEPQGYVRKNSLKIKV